MLLSTDGRFFTLDGSKLPGGRGNGEAIRTYHRPAAGCRHRHHVCACAGPQAAGRGDQSGHGFVTNEDEAVAMTKNGKRVMNVKPGVEAISCRAGPAATASRWSARTASC